MNKKPHEVTPTEHEDGSETVTLYGTVVDVTGLKEFDLFKKHYKVARPKKAKATEDTKMEQEDER